MCMTGGGCYGTTNAGSNHNTGSSKPYTSSTTNSGGKFFGSQTITVAAPNAAGAPKIRFSGKRG